jgi:hypothetical protein
MRKYLEGLRMKIIIYCEYQIWVRVPEKHAHQRRDRDKTKRIRKPNGT